MSVNEQKKTTDLNSPPSFLHDEERGGGCIGFIDQSPTTTTNNLLDDFPSIDNDFIESITAFPLNDAATTAWSNDLEVLLSPVTPKSTSFPVYPSDPVITMPPVQIQVRNCQTTTTTTSTTAMQAFLNEDDAATFISSLITNPGLSSPPPLAQSPMLQPVPIDVKDEDTDPDTSQPSTARSKQHLDPQFSVSSETSCYVGGEFTDGFTPIRLYIKEGFSVSPKEKQPSGHNNRQKLPKHIIEISCSSNQHFNLASEMPLKARASLVCFKNKYSKSKKIISDVISETNLISLSDIEGPVGNADHQQKRWIAVFDNMVIQKTSHMNFGTLFLRFIVFSGERVLAHIDSAGFETITVRGWKKREDKKRKQLERGEHVVPVQPVQETNLPRADAIDPSVGLARGLQFVIITGRKFKTDAALSNVQVRFGENLSTEIFCVRKDRILCETPAHPPGEVTVSVSFDNGASYIEGNLKYKYVDETTEEGKRALLSHGFRGLDNNEQQRQRQQQQQTKRQRQQKKGDGDSSDSGGGTFGGFGYLSRCCARGNVDEVERLLLASRNNKADKDDNNDDDHDDNQENQDDRFGRTPLHWAFYSSASAVGTNNKYIVELLLASAAARDAGMYCLRHVDCFAENPLHIAADRNSLEATRAAIQWAFEHDNPASNTNASELLLALNSENVDDMTPDELADSKQHHQLAELLRETRSQCIEMLEKRYTPLRSVNLRLGGKDNGGAEEDDVLVLQNAQLHLKSANECVIRFDLLKKKTTTTTTTTSNVHAPAPVRVRFTIHHDNLRFLVLVKNQSTAEFSFIAPPEVRIKPPRDEEEQEQETSSNSNTLLPLLSSVLSLVVEIAANAQEAIDLLNAHFALSKSLINFQKNCFSAKSLFGAATSASAASNRNDKNAFGGGPAATNNNNSNTATATNNNNSHLNSNINGNGADNNAR